MESIHEIVGWVEGFDKKKSALLIRDRGVIRKLKIKKASKEIREALIDGGRKALVRVKVSRSDGELIADSLQMIHILRDVSPSDVPDPSKPDEFARKSWLVIRTPKSQKVLLIQHAILKYLREFLDSEGFVEILPPVISTASDPGLRGASKLKTKVYGVEYELTSSTIMFKQVAATSLGKIYFVARNVREEPPENLSTGRHLVEFTQLDLEWAGASIHDVMDLAERMIEYVCRKLNRSYGGILKDFRKNGLQCWDRPLDRLSYKEVLKVAKSLGVNVKEGLELSQEAEEAVSLALNKPFWITNYPAGSRGFYYLRDENDPSVNRDFNLILPEGYGEVIDGGEREYRYEGVIERLKGLGEDLRKYDWFLEALKYGIAPSAGFGLGIERFTRYALGLKYVWEAVPFPKPPGIAGTP